jgi:AcrR family transcriptional regulator
MSEAAGTVTTSNDRPRRSDATRAAILDAARARFAADGYDRATIRAIAGDAGIDPSMVMRYYGSKENLFALAARFDLRLPDFAAVPADRLGETAVRTFLDRWDEPSALPILLRTAMTNESAALALQRVFGEQVAAALGDGTPTAESAERAAMVASQLLGLALCRYVLRLAPLSELDTDALVARFAPTVQGYLTGPLRRG